MINPSSKFQSSGKGAKQVLDPVAKCAGFLALDAIVDPLPHLLALDQPRFAQQPQVMRDRGLLHRYRRLEIADAYATFVAREYIQELQPHRVRELLQVSRQLRRFRIGASRAGVDVAAALTQLSVDNLECSRHADTLSSISTIVNILGRRKLEDEEAGKGAPGTSKGCNVGVLQRPSTGVACASPIPVAFDEQCATALPKPSEIFPTKCCFRREKRRSGYR
jgi:hypothetical protein